MLSSALIGCFTVLLISKKETQGGKYIFKYFLSQLNRRVIILHIKRVHQGAVINTRGIAFERSVDRVIVSLSIDAMHKLSLYYGATVLTTHFTRPDACQWCSGSVNHSPSSSSYSVYVVSEILCTVTVQLAANHIPLVTLALLAFRGFLYTDTNPSLHFTSPAQPGTLHLFP